MVFGDLVGGSIELLLIHLEIHVTKQNVLLHFKQLQLLRVMMTMIQLLQTLHLQSQFLVNLLINQPLLLLVEFLPLLKVLEQLLVMKQMKLIPQLL